MKHTFEAEPKSPLANIGYSMDVNPWLDGDPLFSFTVTCEDPDLTLTEKTADSGIIYWVAGGGVPGKDYYVVVTFNISLIKGDARTVKIPCRTR